MHFTVWSHPRLIIMLAVSPHSPKQSLTSKILRNVFWIIVDGLIISLCYIFSFSLRTLTSQLDYLKSSPFILAATIITLTSFYFFHIYHYVWSQTSGHSVVKILQAYIIAVFIIGSLDLLITPRPLPLSVVIAANAFALSATVALRYRQRLIKGFNWRWRVIWNQEFPETRATRVLIVGAGESGQNIALRLYRARTEHYNIVGFVDDDAKKQGLFIESARVIGARKDIPQLVTTYKIDLVIVAIHNIDGTQFRDILQYCEKTSARVKVVPDTLGSLNDTSHAPQLRNVLPEDLIGRSIVERHPAVDLSLLTGSSVLVTGAAGSIGSELTRQLATYELSKLLILDNNESDLHDLSISLKAKYPQLEIISVLASVTQDEPLQSVFKTHRPQFVFHAAAYKHVPILEIYPNEALKTNIGGTLNLVNLSHQYGVERFVLISTDKAVNPSSVMGASKRICEHIIHAYAMLYPNSTLYTAVRFGNVLGSRGSVIPTFNRQIDDGGPVTVTHPEMTRYFMSIAEAANLVIHAACMTKNNEIFLLQMGETVKILDIAERMIRLRGLRPYIDIPIEFTGVRPGEKMHEELRHEQEAPSETAHPSIFKLNGWPEGFDANQFLVQVTNLLKNGIAANSDPLSSILSTAEYSQVQLPSPSLED